MGRAARTRGCRKPSGMHVACPGVPFPNARKLSYCHLTGTAFPAGHHLLLVDGTKCFPWLLPSQCVLRLIPSRPVPELRENTALSYSHCLV